MKVLARLLVAPRGADAVLDGGQSARHSRHAQGSAAFEETLAGLRATGETGASKSAPGAASGAGRPASAPGLERTLTGDTGASKSAPGAASGAGKPASAPGLERALTGDGSRGAHPLAASTRLALWPAAPPEATARTAPQGVSGTTTPHRDRDSAPEAISPQSNAPGSAKGPPHSVGAAIAAATSGRAPVPGCEPRGQPPGSLSAGSAARAAAPWRTSASNKNATSTVAASPSHAPATLSTPAASGEAAPGGPSITGGPDHAPAPAAAKNPSSREPSAKPARVESVPSATPSAPKEGKRTRGEPTAPEREQATRTGSTEGVAGRSSLAQAVAASTMGQAEVRPTTPAHRTHPSTTRVGAGGEPVPAAREQTSREAPSARTEQTFRPQPAAPPTPDREGAAQPARAPTAAGGSPEGRAVGASSGTSTKPAAEAATASTATPLPLQGVGARPPEAARVRTAAPPPLPPLPAEPGETVVSGAVMPAAAHLRLSSDTLGEVALHLRLQDGAAHIRIEGTDKSAVEARAPELVRALAAEGIGLARIEVQTSPARPDSDGSPGGMQPDLQRQSNPGEGGGQDPSPWDGGEARSPSASAPTLSPNTAPRPARAHPGAVDVTA